MATNYKVLGQLRPGANTLADLYTVPSSTECVVSTIAVCNQTAVNASYSIAIAPDGATANDAHFIIRGGAVPQADSIGVTLGIAMNAADKIRVNTSTLGVSFSAFGSEIS
jgi:hypothetical protein|tara:strand:+ start:4418 stop:4747 length:330 start_codon:yes stop_codon:yes gene_type:complete